MRLFLSVLTAMTAWAETESTDYIDADGKTFNENATVLTGAENELAAGWYVVKSDITYNHTLKLGTGEVNIILANGKKMSIGTEEAPNQLECGFKENDELYGNRILNIYGQTTDTNVAGSLEVYAQRGIYGIEYYFQYSGNVKSVATGGEAIWLSCNSPWMN